MASLRRAEQLVKLFPAALLNVARRRTRWTEAPISRSPSKTPQPVGDVSAGLWACVEMSEGLALASQGGDGTGCEFPEWPKADFRPHPADLLKVAFVSAPRVGGDFVRCRPVRALCWIGFLPRADALGCSSFAAFAAFIVVPAPDLRRGFSGRSGARSSGRLRHGVP